MKGRIVWKETVTEYREIRPSRHGSDLRWIVNRETTLNSATGETLTRGVHRHPGIAVVVPFLAGDSILMMRQYRYSIDRELWELPAGTLNGREESGRMVPTESPVECAIRELEEETGYRAGRLKKVAECYAMPGSSDELIHVFFAYGLTKTRQSLDAGELISEVRPETLSNIETLIAAGGIRDAKTLIGLFYALRGTRNEGAGGAGEREA